MSPAVSDAELVARAKSADSAALAMLYERYAPAIYRYLFFRLHDHEEAEDLCADVFVRMLEGLDRYEERGWPVSAWLYRIARDRLADAVRRQRRRPQTRLEDWSAWCDGPEQIVPTQLLYQELSARLDSLTPEQRGVVQLRFFEDLSIQEAASRLGRSEGAVKSMQHRALQRLARSLQSPPSA